MDNQQERLFFIGYLVAMFDGEGYFQLALKYKTNKGPYYAPRVGVANTDPKIIQLIIDVLKGLEIPFHVWAPKKHGKEKKPVYRITIVGIKRVKKLSSILLQFPMGKKERLEVLNEYCDYRLSKPYGESNNRDEEFKQRLAELNSFRGKESSETTRFTV